MVAGGAVDAGGEVEQPFHLDPSPCRGRPLTDYQVIVETIAATRTEAGLTVEAVLDPGQSPTGVKVSDAEMRAVPISRDAFHGEWNYVIHSGPISEPVQDKAITSKKIK